MTKWWEVKEVIEDKLREHEKFKVETEVQRNYLTFMSFNERVPTGVLSLFDKYGWVNLTILLRDITYAKNTGEVIWDIFKSLKSQLRKSNSLNRVVCNYRKLTLVN